MAKKIPRLYEPGVVLLLADVAHWRADCACEGDLRTGLVLGVHAGRNEVADRKATESDGIRGWVEAGLADGRADFRQLDVSVALLDRDGVIVLPQGRKRVAVRVVLLAVDLCWHASDDRAVLKDAATSKCHGGDGDDKRGRCSVHGIS